MSSVLVDAPNASRCRNLVQLGWKLQTIVHDDWEGLIRYYPQLWAAAGMPKPMYHGGWMRDLGFQIEDVVSARPATASESRLRGPQARPVALQEPRIVAVRRYARSGSSRRKG